MTPLHYYKVYYLAEQFLNGDTAAPSILRLPLVLPGLCLPIDQAGNIYLSQEELFLSSASPQHQDVLQQDDEDKDQAGAHPHI